TLAAAPVSAMPPRRGRRPWRRPDCALADGRGRQMLAAVRARSASAGVSGAPAQPYSVGNERGNGRNAAWACALVAARRRRAKEPAPEAGDGANLEAMMLATPLACLVPQRQ